MNAAGLSTSYAGRVLGAFGLVLAVTTVTACGGGSSGASSAASTGAATASASAATAPDTTASAAASSTAATSSSGSQAPTGSAKVKFGQSSLVQLNDFSTEKSHPIKLTLSLRAGSLSDLKNFDLDAQTKQSTPYYLSMKVTNVGTTSIDTSGFAGNLTVNDAAGDEVSSLTLLGDFSKCEGDIPDKLAPGASAQECDVYPAPSGQKVASASIDNGENDATVTWS